MLQRSMRFTVSWARVLCLALRLHGYHTPSGHSQGGRAQLPVPGTPSQIGYSTSLARRVIPGGARLSFLPPGHQDSYTWCEVWLGTYPPPRSHGDRSSGAAQHLPGSAAAKEEC